MLLLRPTSRLFTFALLTDFYRLINMLVPKYFWNKGSENHTLVHVVQDTNVCSLKMMS